MRLIAFPLNFSYLIQLAVLQRVSSASVTVDKELVSSIGRGILVLAGVGKGDTEKDADSLVGRVLKAKLWPEEGGAQASHFISDTPSVPANTILQWKKNVQDLEGELLCGMFKPNLQYNMNSNRGSIAIHPSRQHEERQ